MIGESVVREKYWDRNDVFRIAAELDPSFAIAALSRWRDREIGFFPHQMQALTTSLVEQKLISPSAAYSLSAFFDGATALPTISACLRGIHNPYTREKFLTLAINDLQLDGIDKHGWEELRALAHELKLPTEQIDHIIHSASAPKSRYWSGESIPRTRRRVVRKGPRITSLFKGVDNLVALGEIWSERPEVESRHHQSPYRSGRRLWVAVDVLQQLCAATGKDLIFSVALERDSDHPSHKPDFPYVPDSHKIFLFSANGRLRDAQKIHHPR